MTEDPNQIQEDLSEILRVRREKLQALREAGSDPYLLTRFDKTHSSAEVIEV
jgi:lysyl-tRNA synthetase class 2